MSLSWKDLCERHEKGVLHKHQRALHKYGLMKRQMMTAAHGREPESVEQLESRIVEVSEQWAGIRKQLGAAGGVASGVALSSGIVGIQIRAVVWERWELSQVLGTVHPVLYCLVFTPVAVRTGQCPRSKQTLCSTSEGPVHRLPLCLQQENVIQTMELRNYFSLYCLHQETQLVHVYLPLTSHILGAFVNSQIQGHKEVSHPSPIVMNVSLSLGAWPVTCSQ